jgi:hypothetical protein
MIVLVYISSLKVEAICACETSEILSVCTQPRTDNSEEPRNATVNAVSVINIKRDACFKNIAFWVVTPCNLVGTYQFFGGSF